MKKLFGVMLLLVVAFVATYAGSPYYAAYQLNQAYQHHDGDYIATQINYAALKPNLTGQLQTRFADTLSQYPAVQKLGGEALTQAADGFIAQAVNGAITPDNLARLISTRGQVNQASKQLAAAWAIASNQIDLRTLIQEVIRQRGDMNAVIKAQAAQIQAKQAQQLAQSEAVDTKPTLTYCGIDCFSISGHVKGYPVTVLMQRQGWFGWQIDNVILP